MYLCNSLILYEYIFELQDGSKHIGLVMYKGAYFINLFSGRSILSDIQMKDGMGGNRCREV